jgi:HEAT repeat protein
MTTLIHWLSEGDLTSDGRANEVAELVASNPALWPDLTAALSSPQPAVRGHAADALEKVTRSHPDWARAHLPALRQLALADPVAMVRWHLAMVLGHLAGFDETVDPSSRTLEKLLHDPSATVRSWALTSLCIIGRLSPNRSPRITRQISALTRDPSAAVRKRALRALETLTDPGLPFPKGWAKGKKVLSSL